MFTVSLHPPTNPNDAPRRTIQTETPSLDKMQATVGGWVDRTTLYRDREKNRTVDLWVHDEGLLIPLRPTVWVGDNSNPTPLVGPIYICAGCELSGESLSLTQEEVDGIHLVRDWLKWTGFGFSPKLHYRPTGPLPHHVVPWGHRWEADPGDEYTIGSKIVGGFSPAPSVRDAWLRQCREEEEANTTA